MNDGKKTLREHTRKIQTNYLLQLGGSREKELRKSAQK
jgi:hypothetical protein